MILLIKSSASMIMDNTWKIQLTPLPGGLEVWGTSPSGSINKFSMPYDPEINGVIIGRRTDNELLVRLDKEPGEELLAAYHISIDGNILEGISLTGMDHRRSCLFFDNDLPPGASAGTLIRLSIPEPIVSSGIRLMMKVPGEEPLPPAEVTIVCQQFPDSTDPIVLFYTQPKTLSESGSGIHTIGIREKINPRGEIVKGLRESEINPLLRKAYTFPNSRVFIVLDNSTANPMHERILNNLLKVAGYRRRYVSYKLEQFLYMCACLSELKTVYRNTLDEGIQKLREELGKCAEIRVEL